MKTQTVLSIVAAFIAVFVTGCASQQGGTVRYQTTTQSQPATKPLSIYGNQPKLSQINRSTLTTKILAQAMDTNEVWNEYKSSARRVVLPDNTLVLVSSNGWVWKADCGNRLLPVEAQQVVVHRPAPVQTVVVEDQPEVRYVHRQSPPQVVHVDAPQRKVCIQQVIQRSRCQQPQYIGGQPIGGWGSFGGGIANWAARQVWDGINSSYYGSRGGQVPFGGGGYPRQHGGGNHNNSQALSSSGNSTMVRNWIRIH